MTQYIPLRLDLRGSINLPAQIKRNLNLSIGGEVLVRQTGGVVLIIPMGGEGGEEFSKGNLDAWVSLQLKQDVPSGSLSVGKTAVAANIKLLAARERFEQEKILLELRLRVAQEERGHRVTPSPPQPAPPGEASDPLAELRAAREADATRQLDAALQQASDEMSGEQPPPFPQQPPPFPQA